MLTVTGPVLISSLKLQLKYRILISSDDDENPIESKIKYILLFTVTENSDTKN